MYRHGKHTNKPFATVRKLPYATENPWVVSVRTQHAVMSYEYPTLERAIERANETVSFFREYYDRYNVVAPIIPIRKAIPWS